MLDNFVRLIYVTDIPVILSAVIVLFVLWSILGVVFSKKMKYAGVLICVLSFVAILYVTIYSRDGSSYGYELVPFSSLYRAIGQIELYRSMLMNILLFLPFGLGLPYVLNSDIKTRFAITLIIGFTLSVIVESVQGVFSLGMMESDDVICNTLGTALGSCSYLLSFLILKQKAKKRGKSGE